MSKTQTDPVIDALAPALAILESGPRDDDLDAMFSGLAAVTKRQPLSLDGLAALLAALMASAPWGRLVMDDGKTLDVSPAELAEYGNRVASLVLNSLGCLALMGHTPPLALARYAVGENWANLHAEMAADANARAARQHPTQPDTDEADDVPAIPQTPEIERIYARWAKARGDMLAAYAVDGPDDAAQHAAEQVGAEASKQVWRECWAMVGTPAKETRHIRFKVEMFRDQAADGLDVPSIELALVNSIDVDLAALG